MSPITLFSAVSDTNLWAYLDPGSGSMAFQFLIAGLLSGMVFFKAGVQSIKRYLSLGAR
jgi:hypothetical protein